jgi:hypothetical protein
MSDLEWTTKAWHEAEDRARKLQARVQELQDELTLMFEYSNKYREENAKLRRVVEMAREASEELNVGVKGFDEISKLLDDAV